MVDLHPPPDLEALWQPLSIGAMRVANRVMTTGHALLYGEGGLISDRHIAYYEERARGGVGLLVTEQQAAHPSGRNYHAGCVAYDERVVLTAGLPSCWRGTAGRSRS